jgi:hypothetical protein
VSATRPSRFRRIAGVTLIVAGVLLAPIALVTNWAVLELSDTNAFVDTFAPLAKDPAVQQLVAEQVTKAIDANVDYGALTAPVFDELAQSLGPKASIALRGLQGAATRGVQQLVAGAVVRFVASDAFAAVWEKALRVTHSQVIGALENDPTTLVAIGPNGELGIQIGPIVEGVKGYLVAQGLGFAERLPTVDRTIVITQSATLVTLQTLYQLAHAIALWLPWVAFALIVGGVLLAGLSTVTVISASASVALAMALLLVGLALGRTLVIAGFVATDLSPGAAAALFGQVVGRIYSSAVTVGVVGFLIAAVVWLLGPFGLAARVRRRRTKAS